MEQGCISNSWPISHLIWLCLCNLAENSWNAAPVRQQYAKLFLIKTHSQEDLICALHQLIKLSNVLLKNAEENALFKSRDIQSAVKSKGQDWTFFI